MSTRRKKWQLKQQSVVVLLLRMLTTLLELCIHDSVLAGPLTQASTVSGTNNERSASLKVMAIVPTMFGLGDPQWMKGEEIIPGAQLAIKEINNIPDLLSNYQLEIIPF